MMWIRVYGILSEKLYGRDGFELTVEKLSLISWWGGVKTKNGWSNGKAGEFFTVHLFSLGIEIQENQEVCDNILYEDT